MLKSSMVDKEDGRFCMLLGLSPDDFARMARGEIMRLPLDDMGATPWSIKVYVAEDQDGLWVGLAQIVGPETTILDDRPLDERFD
jgi:hypothetical protein